MKKRARPFVPRPAPSPSAVAAHAPAGATATTAVASAAQPGDTAHAATEVYDDGLLDRARGLWRRGDWAALVALDSAEVAAHPQRARLALLVAAGHQALADATAARQWARLARQWGCSREQLAAVLVAGVCNTLGRAAAAAGQRERTLAMFERALDIGLPGASGRMALHDRIEHQLAPLGLSLPAAAGSASPRPAAPARSPFQALADQVRQQSQALAQVKRQLEHTVRTEVLNATKQIEAFASVQTYLAGGELVPAMHGWPVSPDFAQLLIELVETGEPGLVIEFGSGTSTRLIAQVLARRAARGAAGPIPAPVQMAFEHLEVYHAQTAGLLAQVGLREAVALHRTPLVPTAVGDAQMPFYDAQAALAEGTALARERHASAPGPLKVLVLVDGPPAATGPQARLPALAVTWPHLAGAELSLLLDDYDRPDERAIAERWLADLRAAGLAPTLQEFKLEKGACLIHCRL